MTIDYPDMPIIIGYGIIYGTIPGIPGIIPIYAIIMFIKSMSWLYPLGLRGDESPALPCPEFFLESNSFFFSFLSSDFLFGFAESSLSLGF